MARFQNQTRFNDMFSRVKNLCFVVFLVCLCLTLIAGVSQSGQKLNPVESKNLARMNLSGKNLRYLDLREANLEGANLRNADLKGSDLQGANLRNADLQGASLKKTDLRNAILVGANLQEVNFREANLMGADLHGAKWCNTLTFNGNMFNTNCPDNQ